MEGLLSFLRMQRSHETAPNSLLKCAFVTAHFNGAANPSQEANRQDAAERLLPSLEGSGMGRSTESTSFV